MVEAAKLANRSADTFHWQQDQPVVDCKLLLWFNLGFSLNGEVFVRF